MPAVTELLNAWTHADREALDRLIPLVYTELRKLAHHYLQAERPAAVTVKVGEVYQWLSMLTRRTFVEPTDIFVKGISDDSSFYTS